MGAIKILNEYKLMISFNVEAQPLQQERAPFNRLIWGEYPERHLEISEIIDIADQHVIKRRIFLNF